MLIQVLSSSLIDALKVLETTCHCNGHVPETVLLDQPQSIAGTYKLFYLSSTYRILNPTPNFQHMRGGGVAWSAKGQMEQTVWNRELQILRVMD